MADCQVGQSPLLDEVGDGAAAKTVAPIRSGISERHALLGQIEEERESKTILYVTGDRQGLQAVIGHDIIDPFVDHLDSIGPVARISLVLYTSGGGEHVGSLESGQSS